MAERFTANDGDVDAPLTMSVYRSDDATVAGPASRSTPGALRPRAHGVSRAGIEVWRRHYNDVRPHSSLGYRTPSEFQ